MTVAEKLAAIQAAAEPYPTCPRCDGERTVRATTDPFALRIEWEEFDCPLCHGAGSLDREAVIDWLEERLEEEENDG